MPSGQIIPRSPDTWLIRLYQGRDPATGKRRYLNKTVRGDRPAAEAELAGLLAQIPSRPRASSKLDEYIDWWLYAAIDGRLRSKTARDYRTMLDRYVRTELGRIRLDRLQPLDIQSLLVGMTTRGLSPRTVRYTHAVLRSALDQARRWKLLTENPAIDMPLPRAERNEFRVLTPEEAKRFVEICRAESEALVFLVALTTGLRPSEYLALRAGDFDPGRSSLTVTRTLERSNGSWKFAETKRPRSRRTVAVPDEVAERLRTLIASEHLEADPLLFRSSTRCPLHERNLVQRVFKPLLRRAGLPDIRLYDLRHTFATLALREGVPARLVSEQLGHASVAFTLEFYGHVLEESRSAGAERLSELLFHPTGERKAVEREIARRKSA
jgi:integrase